MKIICSNSRIYICFLLAIIYFTLNTRVFSQDLETNSSWKNIADSVVKHAKDQLGTTYVWGTCKPDVSFDCSGLSYYAYNKAGIKCSRSASAYKNFGDKVPLKNCRKGDCILFTGTNSKDKSVGHVGIIVKNEGDKLFFIHCSSSKKHYGVVITEYYASNYPKRFIGIRRLFR